MLIFSYRLSIAASSKKEADAAPASIGADERRCFFIADRA
jgi:hypothetical protein